MIYVSIWLQIVLISDRFHNMASSLFSLVCYRYLLLKNKKTKNKKQKTKDKKIIIGPFLPQQKGVYCLSLSKRTDVLFTLTTLRRMRW